MFIAKMPSLKDKYLGGLDKEKNKVEEVPSTSKCFYKY